MNHTVVPSYFLSSSLPPRNSSATNAFPCLVVYYLSADCHVCIIRQRGFPSVLEVIILSASERMWSPVRPIDWKCWWIALNVQQAIPSCSVCRPVVLTAPIRPDIKRLDHIRGSSRTPTQWLSLWGAFVTIVEVKTDFRLCSNSEIKHALHLYFNANW